MRKFLSILLGLVAGILVITLIQLISHLVFAMPEGLEVTGYGRWGPYLSLMPRAALATILVGWFTGTFAGSYIATRSGQDISLSSAAVGGTVYGATGVIIMLSAPYPAWMWLIGLACIFLGAAFGGNTAISSGYE